MSYVKFLVSKRGLFCNYSMLAPYSIVFTAHSSLQKHAMHTKKSVYCDNDSTLTKMFSVGYPTGVSGELHNNWWDSILS